jgi:hypothetical protein
MHMSYGARASVLQKSPISWPIHIGMVPDRSALDWLSEFCIRLMQLRPEIGFTCAVRRGVAAYAHAYALDPQEAAELLVYAVDEYSPTAVARRNFAAHRLAQPSPRSYADH